MEAWKKFCHETSKEYTWGAITLKKTNKAIAQIKKENGETTKSIDEREKEFLKYFIKKMTETKIMNHKEE